MRGIGGRINTNNLMTKNKHKKKKINLFSWPQKNWKKVLVWLAGPLVTIILTKACNAIWPDTPVVVKEHTDTVKVVHSMDPIQVDSDSIIREQIKYQLMNIELLNKYEEQITGKREATKVNVCKIITGNPYPNSRGYTMQTTSSYCFIELNANGPFIDIAYDFFHEDYIDLVNTLCVKISRKDNEGRDFIVSDMNYEPHMGDNGCMVRMVNDFPSGQYTIEAGFILKENKLDKYPTFYRQTFTFKK